MKRYFFSFLMRGEAERMIFEVAEQEQIRLSACLETFDPSQTIGFFGFDSTDGQSVHLNLAELQVARQLWEPIWISREAEEYEGGVKLKFRDRPEIFDEFVEPEDCMTLVEGLADESTLFVTFVDGDGEEYVFAKPHLIWAIVPTKYLQGN
ncbi:hypothetical protein RD110_08165 [Rhodoferax koreense]|uniref:Uncharacterized protein n=1 Tax=Rhodoferax koreensis TaxID=1842727 RepID=A0A1P8JTY1_9BURK|nr:hypothetical protein [Rhodoferax koreense]APW37178.1 hypothetical protein RD110_08165 [Rhodoferax koreense]